MTGDLFGADGGFEQIRMSDAEVYYLKQLDLNLSYAAVLRWLIAEIPWKSEEIVLWGRKIRQPRLTAWFGDPGCDYTYSGIHLNPSRWTEILSDIKARVEAAIGSSFNSVLLNYYRDHRDSMGFHSDDEPELGPRPVIASLSLGADRVFVMKHKTRRDLKPVRLRLASGSLLLMKGDTQRCWRHGVPKETQPCGPRINLTFRRISLEHERRTGNTQR
jgi:alkylated DNA repair dioxygenase AlkB